MPRGSISVIEPVQDASSVRKLSEEKGDVLSSSVEEHFSYADMVIQSQKDRIEFLEKMLAKAERRNEKLKSVITNLCDAL